GARVAFDGGPDPDPDYGRNGDGDQDNLGVLDRHPGYRGPAFSEILREAHRHLSALSSPSSLLSVESSFSIRRVRAPISTDIAQRSRRSGASGPVIILSVLLNSST